jgi:20S proteasome alpha/beta subunit
LNCEDYIKLRYLNRRPILTCVIGATCADGCIIVSDTRVMREFEATNESKIHLIGKRAVLAGAGTAALLDKLAGYISKSGVSTATDFHKVVEDIEDITFEMRQRYHPMLDNQYNFQALIMGLQEFDKGDPFIRLIHAAGISEVVKNFAIIGHGAPYVAALFKLMYDNMLNVNELAALGYFCIASIVFLGLDQTVGMSPLGPEAIVLRTNEEPRFLNPLQTDFCRARESLNNLQFRFKLVKSIWPQIPQAFGNLDPSLF